MTTEEYFKGNPIVKEFVEKADKVRFDYFETNFPALFNDGRYKKLEVIVGNKYIKLVADGSVWGFISRYDGLFKGRPIRKGDLLKADNWRTPSAVSRGNIVDGTERFGPWGPDYLK
jgi:hypothetical protein